MFVTNILADHSTVTEAFPNSDYPLNIKLPVDQLLSLGAFSLQRILVYKPTGDSHREATEIRGSKLKQNGKSSGTSQEGRRKDDQTVRF
jgi:hypothetical protein